MANMIEIMDTFINDTKTSMPQWVVFSAVRCLYENHIGHYAKIVTPDVQNKNTILDFRNFALYKQGYNSNVLYNYEQIPISQELWNLLIHYKNTVVDTIPIKQYEAYIILTMYPKMLLKENVKFIITEFINFTSLIDFLDLLNLMQHNKFSLEHIKRLFKNVLYDELLQELLGKKYNFNITIFNQAYPVSCTLNTIIVEGIVNSLIKTKENATILLSPDLELDPSIRLQIESYIKTLKLNYQDDLIDKIVNCKSHENISQIPTMEEMIEINVKLYTISETNKIIDNLNKLSSTFIPSKVMTLPKLIRNTELLILLKIMEPNVKKLSFYSDLMKMLCNQNSKKISKTMDLSKLISNKRKLNNDNDEE